MIKSDEAKCRVCGCSWFNPCSGGCWWVVEGSLCSNCASRLGHDINTFIIDDFHEMPNDSICLEEFGDDCDA